MSCQIYRTQEAVNDIDSIYEYIAQQLGEPQSAIEQIRRIDARIELIAFMPELFHEMKEPHRGLRISPVDNYVIIYKVDNDSARVDVLRVLYGGANIAERL